MVVINGLLFNCGNTLIGYLNIGYNLNLIITQWNQDS